MSENTGTPEQQAETTSVFRADLIKEMESNAGSAAVTENTDNLVTRRRIFSWMTSRFLVATQNFV